MTVNTQVAQIDHDYDTTDIDCFRTRDAAQWRSISRLSPSKLLPRLRASGMSHMFRMGYRTSTTDSSLMESRRTVRSTSDRPLAIYFPILGR